MVQIQSNEYSTIFKFSIYHQNMKKYENLNIQERWGFDSNQCEPKIVFLNGLKKLVYHSLSLLHLYSILILYSIQIQIFFFTWYITNWYGNFIIQFAKNIIWF